MTIYTNSLTENTHYHLVKYFLNLVNLDTKRNEIIQKNVITIQIQFNQLFSEIFRKYFPCVDIKEIKNIPLQKLKMCWMGIEPNLGSMLAYRFLCPDLIVSALHSGQFFIKPARFVNKYLKYADTSRAVDAIHSA